MKIATIPIASIATKMGMKAMTNLVAKSRTPRLWIVIGQFPTPNAAPE
jgi:hypothetical protein